VIRLEGVSRPERRTERAACDQPEHPAP